MPQNPFADWPRTPAAHFRLYFFAAVSRLLRELIRITGSADKTFGQYPFLVGYANELAAHEPNSLDAAGAARWWQTILSTWETAAVDHLPLRSLRDVCGLEHDAMTLLLGIGLIEEDARFGLLFESMQGLPGQQRPTVGLLHSWWSNDQTSGEMRTSLRRLSEFGLVQFVGTEAPRTNWALEFPTVLWDAIRGERHETFAPWVRYQAPDQLATFEQLTVPRVLHEQVKMLPALLATGEAGALIVRGPRHNGRRTLVGALARQLGRGLLAVTNLDQPQDSRWQIVGPLATALNAVPLVVLDLAPGENQELPALSAFEGPRAFVLGRHGGIAANDVQGAITLSLEMPDVAERKEHWRSAYAGKDCEADLEALSRSFRLTGGNIRRTARLAQTTASLAGRNNVILADVQEAGRALNREALDTLATRIPSSGDWSCLALQPDTLRELRDLESRCRHRERLHLAVGTVLGDQLNAGVRALFSGSSGTGKTLSARALAGVLRKDLYRLDLSTVVNKYIGETEKNLNRVFARAEELDVILLLDEGDALLTQRTDVHNANDRYANLETNYLLQRLESYEGILIVTTNAGDRIDSAFQRRMDVVISFPSPDVRERWTIWQLHLPATHKIPESLLDEVAHRCELNGGQIRNAVLHASLLALENGGVVSAVHLEAAVQREYNKFGAVCPLREYALEISASRW